MSSFHKHLPGKVLFCEISTTYLKSYLFPPFLPLTKLYLWEKGQGNNVISWYNLSLALWSALELVLQTGWQGWQRQGYRAAHAQEGKEKVQGGWDRKSPGISQRAGVLPGVEQFPGYGWEVWWPNGICSSDCGSSDLHGDSHNHTELELVTVKQQQDF